MEFNSITIEDSNYCNMNCSYCNFWNIPKQQKLLSQSKIEDIYSWALQQDYIIDISHLYTEPLLNWDNIKNSYDAIKDKKDYIKLFTNGLLLNGDIIDYCLLNNIILSVSFDGLEQYRRSQESKTILHNLCYNYPYSFIVLTTIHKTLWTDFVYNIDYLLKLPVKQINLSLNYNLGWTEEEVQKIYDYLLQLDADSQKKLGLSDLSLQHPLLNPQANRINALFIDVDGNVRDYIDAQTHPFITDNILSNWTTIDYSNIDYYSETFQCEKCQLYKTCHKDKASFIKKQPDFTCIELRNFYRIMEKQDDQRRIYEHKTASANARFNSQCN